MGKLDYLLILLVSLHSIKILEQLQQINVERILLHSLSSVSYFHFYNIQLCTGTPEKGAERSKCPFQSGI